jgi:3-deoxy-7-phosphoheptulonate synthase
MRYGSTITRCEVESPGTGIVQRRTLTPPELVMRELPSTDAIRGLIATTRTTIARILTGDDPRLLAIVGPCSIHSVDAALRYARWLAVMRTRFAPSLCVVMRAYVEKPRTRHGWKGLINDPDLDDRCDIERGVRLARQLLLDINALGLPTATEFVDPITAHYLGDLVSWVAIGARTTESPVHRQLASGLACPVGFKNSTQGDVRPAIDAVAAARQPQQFVSLTVAGTASIVASSGNRACHVVLRGGARSNCDEGSVTAVAEALVAEGLEARVLIDCSHGNCGGQSLRQLEAADEVVRQVRNGSYAICGVMVESNLRAGTQRGSPPPYVPEQSLTDPCLGLEDTEVLLARLAGAFHPVAGATRDTGAAMPQRPPNVRV